MLIFCVSLSAQDQSVFSYFDSEGVTEITLSTDMSLLVKKKSREEYQPAHISWVTESGDSVAMDVKIRARGNIRKQVCYYPPIRITFPKKSFKFRKTKWVNSCSDNNGNEQWLLKEYLAYKIFNILTDKSFKTRLFHITYKNTKKDKAFTRYGYIIEHEDELALRLGGKVYEPKILKESLLEPEQLNLYTAFQYLIGNTDWAFLNRHNVEIITDPSKGMLLAIPYDFDYSGLVDAEYAVPHETVPIDDVSDRFNKGLCMTEAECQAVCKIFIEKKNEIMQEVENFSLLNKKTKAWVIDYFEDFFEVIENPKSATRCFVRDCKKKEVN
jgi:hypothetical protein